MAKRRSLMNYPIDEVFKEKLDDLHRQIDELKKLTHPRSQKVIKKRTCFIPLADLESLDELIEDAIKDSNLDDVIPLFASNSGSIEDGDVPVTITYETEE